MPCCLKTALAPRKEERERRVGRLLLVPQWCWSLQCNANLLTKSKEMQEASELAHGLLRNVCIATVIFGADPAALAP